MYEFSTTIDTLKGGSLMKQEYTIIEGLDKFASAQEHFSHLIERLQWEEIRHWEHGEIENLIWKEGNELLRRLLQGHLDIRFVLEKKLEAVKGADGIMRSHCRQGCERKLMSLFGEVVVRRMGYGVRGGSSIFPMDAKLNLPPDKYSHGLRQQIAEEVSKNSFDEAVSMLQRRTAGKVPKRQAEEISVEVSEDFEEFYNAGRSEEPESREDLLIMSQDGKGIVMRKEDLRDATRKAANREEGKSKSRLGQGQKRNRKRMATVASVYSIERDLRTAEEIMEPEKPVESRPRPRAQNKRVWASVQRDMRVVTDEVFQEALRRDPKKSRKWIMLVDGHKEQLKQIRSCIKRYGVKVIVVLDFIHVLEYLWKAAYCFYSAGSKEAEAWVSERALYILQGKASQVAAGMRRSATLRRLSADKRKAVDRCSDYLLKYKDMLRYDEYLAEGLPIATGVIEGTCRHLVKDRMDITGARWGLRRAEAILKLRSLYSSRDSDDYWNFYKAQTLQRNHLSQYENYPLQKVA